MKYSAGMASCLFWLSETRKTADLIISGKPKSEIKELALKDNLYQVKAEERALRIYGVAIKRLESLPDSLKEEIAYGDIATAKLLVLISIMKTDLLFFEFVREVHRQAIILGENKITDKAVNTFFDTKMEQSELVQKWSEKIRKKLKQLYIKLLFEAGVLTSTTGDRKIIIPVINYRLRDTLEENNLIIYLKAITGEE